MVSKIVVNKILEQIGSSLNADLVGVAYTESPSPGFAAYSGDARVAFKAARPGLTDRDLITELLREVEEGLTRLADAVTSDVKNDTGGLRGNVRPHDGIKREEPDVGPGESGVSHKRRGRRKKTEVTDVTKQTSNTDTETTD